MRVILVGRYIGLWDVGHVTQKRFQVTSVGGELIGNSETIGGCSNRSLQMRHGSTAIASLLVHGGGGRYNSVYFFFSHAALEMIRLDDIGVYYGEPTYRHYEDFVLWSELVQLQVIYSRKGPWRKL